MSLANLIAGAIALLLFVRISLIGGSANEGASLFEKFSPLGAIDGITFFLAFGYGVPGVLAWIIGAGIVIGLPILLFFGLRRVIRAIERRK